MAQATLPETTHTPGPWRVSTGCDQYVCAEGCWIAATMGTRGEEGAANAALIARAPDLLAENERLRAALRRLAGNAGALRAFEPEIREAAGNTNWQCLVDAIADADAALSEQEGK